MTYNDYPILNDDEYFILQTQYNNFSFNRNENVYKIFLSLQECIMMFYTSENIFNLKINQSLTLAKQTTQNILDNLVSLFNFKSVNKNIQTGQNIFTLTKQIINCSKQLLEWCNLEKKEYYKKIAYTSAIDLLHSVNLILNAMEQSF